MHSTAESALQRESKQHEQERRAGSRGRSVRSRQCESKQHESKQRESKQREQERRAGSRGRSMRSRQRESKQREQGAVGAGARSRSKEQGARGARCAHTIGAYTMLVAVHSAVEQALQRGRPYAARNRLKHNSYLFAYRTRVGYFCCLIYRLTVPPFESQPCHAARSIHGGHRHNRLFQ